MGSYYGTYYGPWTHKQQRNIEKKLHELEHRDSTWTNRPPKEVADRRNEIARLKKKATVFGKKLRLEEIEKAKQVAKKLIMLQNKRGFGGAPIVQRAEDVQEADDDVQDVTAEIKKAKAKDIEWVSLLSDDDEDDTTRENQSKYKRFRTDEERYRANVLAAANLAAKHNKKRRFN